VQRTRWRQEEADKIKIRNWRNFGQSPASFGANESIEEDEKSTKY
jgi:hypothetical protein